MPRPHWLAPAEREARIAELEQENIKLGEELTHIRAAISGRGFVGVTTSADIGRLLDEFAYRLRKTEERAEKLDRELHEKQITISLLSDLNDAQSEKLARSALSQGGE